MASPFVLVQLSDLHLGASWLGRDPVAALGAAIDGVLALPQRPDAVLVSGDLSDRGDAGDYAIIAERLEALDAPVWVLAGNHDDRAALRASFGLGGSGAEPVQYAADLGPIRLIALDTTIPGRDDGSLDNGRLEWLGEALADAPSKPVILAMHHPPMAIGVPAMDGAGLAASDRAALAEIVGRHPQVKRLVAGHVHRAVAGEVAGRVALTAPSTYMPTKLDFCSNEFGIAAGPAGFSVHVLLEGVVHSHVQPVAAGP